MSRIAVWRRWPSHTISFPTQRQAARSPLWLFFPALRIEEKEKGDESAFEIKSFFFIRGLVLGGTRTEFAFERKVFFLG